MEESSYEEKFKDDCDNYYVLNTYLPAPKRIIVLGDVHGDENVVYSSLKLAKIIDDNGKWIAQPPDTYVVQVGDQIDRCRPLSNELKCSNKDTTYKDEASDIKLLYFFTNLDKQARQYNGRVVSLLGNHEIMNAQGIMDYVSYKGQNEMNGYTENDVTYDGLNARKHRFKPGNDLAKLLACTRLSCIVIGSCLFVHAGIIPDLKKKLSDILKKNPELNDYKMDSMTYIEQINTIVRKWLLGHLKEKNVYDLLNSNNVSPFWPRILGQIPPNVSVKECDTYVKPILKLLKIGHIIIGHTPQMYEKYKEDINSTCDDAVWRSDVGSSNAFHPFDNIPQTKKIQVLEILHDGKNTKFNVLKIS